MSEVELRPVADGDLDAAARVLNPWFVSYVDHLDYSAGMLRFLDRAVWAEGRVGVAAWQSGHLCGVLIGGLRQARFGGQRLRSVNISLVAVDHRLRRQGVGRRMVEAFAALSREAGADLLSLNTMEIYRSHQLYEVTGFRRLERFQAPGAQIGEVVEVPGVRQVDAATFVSRRPLRLPRPGAIAEGPALPPPGDDPVVPVRWYLGGRAGVATATWPVRLRVDGEHQLVRSCQVLDAWGEGVELAATLSTALAHAKAEGCGGVYQLPCVTTVHESMRTGGAGWTLRYARGLTAAGEAAVSEARAYDEVCPAP